MKNYELTVIVRNRDVENRKQEVKDILAKHGVIITKEDHWGQRRLAYEIDREKEAYYMYMLLQAQPEAIDKINQEFRINANILRYLFVLLEEEKTA
ncbi:MAG TPA: 30S ribosomal protein S6 [Spirochaetota bacterium]|jgi:small subunit ribosomal protein S6|nr:30S ribosomal protein S6 [Spirochaetota bacterium]HOK92617.1 30S ribosomal protein S6 [Spirochaetota bacterium]HON16489.1 30S ribosomal protein S6 [Spirochaetota bacterium]HOV09452.1 30S ribosomal protein S6 [Spirochaetota bacterium]HPD76950.1 30S ribosomal protein S6 [Spirochaetota bacterium]